MRKLNIMIPGIIKVGLENQMPRKDEQCMDDDRPSRCMAGTEAPPRYQATATVRLVFRDLGFGQFGNLPCHGLQNCQT